MVDDLKEDVNKGWGRLKVLWKTLTDEAKWKVISLILAGVIIGIVLF